MAQAFPGMPGWVFAANASNLDYFDMRLLYDETRDRIWLFVNHLDQNNANPITFAFVSRSNNPARDGWYGYLWPSSVIPNTWGDYPQVGINSTMAVITNVVRPFGAGKFYSLTIALDPNAMAAGSNQVTNWFWDSSRSPYPFTDPTDGGSPAITPNVAHVDNGAGTYLVGPNANHLGDVVIFKIYDLTSGRYSWSVVANSNTHAPLVNGQQLGGKTINMGGGGGGNGNAVRAVWRANTLYVGLINSWNIGGTVYATDRLLKYNVSSYPTVTQQLDWSWGNGSAYGTVHCAFPAFEVNSLGDMAFASARTSASTYPEIMLQAWYTTSPNGGESGIQMKAGEQTFFASATQAPPLPYQDTTGSSLDPYDNVGVWLAQEYPDSAPGDNWAIWVSKEFGSANCAHNVCAGGASLAATCDYCTQTVCAADPYCCDTAWDYICVGHDIPNYCPGYCNFN